MPKNYCIMQIWAESGKSALPICNYSQILYQFLTFTQNLKRSQDLDIYTSPDDLLSKCEYYLSHEKERIEIAENGYQKVLNHYTYEKQLQKMLSSARSL